MRHRFIALPLAALATLALASVALAGGWAQVTVTDTVVDPPAGEETTIDLEVLQHGSTPVSWPTLTVVATDASSGTVVRADAQATGAEGSYVAKIVFPTAGDWTLSFESTELDMQGALRVSVAPPIAPAQPAAAARAAATFDAMPLALLLVAAVLAIAIAGLVVRSGRAPRGKRVSVRT